ncbi:MAG: flagellar motor switch protein FliN [Treponema sp.]|nr:flagellar motor switch protein FliN [Treponema sp.]
MSDGALSQDEIDALLSGTGVDSSGGGSAFAAVANSSFSETDRKTLETFFSSTTEAQSSNLSMMTGVTVLLSKPQLTINGHEDFLEQLPETVTVIKSDFNSGFPGDHLFIISEEGAKAIASMMNKEENIQLDEMAMSVIGEVISQLVGYQITTLSDKTGNKSISSIPPEVNNISKNIIALPPGDFAGLTYEIDLGKGGSYSIWEVLGPSVAMDIAKSLNNFSTAKSGKASMSAAPAGIGKGGMGSPFNQANVQSVQFPNLMQPHGGAQEASNISLIMDVYMEMTVELGRTRKLIKEILAMGEGTIIELDKLAGEPVDILVNHKLIAKGEVVVIDENFGVRVTEIVSPMERMHDMG